MKDPTDTATISALKAELSEVTSATVSATTQVTIDI